MRAIWPAAVALAALMVLPAAAQTGSASSPQGEGAASTPPRGSLPRMATNHQEIARRMADRRATETGAAPAAAPNPKVAAAAKAADDAVVNDPTVRAMLNGSMSKPPSLAGGAPGLPAPPTPTPP